MADIEVRMDEEDEPVIKLRDEDATSLTLYTESNGDGTSESSAFETYMPIDGGSGEDSYHYYSEEFDVPDKDSTTAGISFDLDLDNGSDSDQRLMVAIKNDDNEYFAISDITNTNFLSYDEICNTVDLDDFDCSDFSSDFVNKDVLIYIYYAEDGSTPATIEQDFDPSDSGLDDGVRNGIYIKLNISSDIEDYDDDSTNISSISASRGDQTIYLDFSGDVAVEADMRGVSLYNASDDSYRDFFEVSDYDGTVSISVFDLVNGTTYDFKLAWIDKWGFRSKLSTSTGSVSPTDVPTLLDETSCYLVTAGFEREHYVLDYFREFRDKVLLNSKIGTGLVVLYYATAPTYANKIKDLASIKLLIRSASFSLYFFMKYWIYCMIAMLLIFSLMILYGTKTQQKNPCH